MGFTVTSRRGRGEGTIEQRGPNTWRLRVYTGADPVTGHPIQVSKTVRAPNRTTALKALRQLVTDVEEGGAPGTSAAMNRLFDDWLAHLERIGRRETTIRSYRGVIATHLRPRFGKMPLRKVTGHDLDRYYADQQAAGMAANTILMHHAILTGALGQAVKWGWLKTNPAQLATPPSRTAGSRRPLSVDDVQKLIGAAGDDIVLATAVTLAAVTGARRGELCGLRWPDVDWDKGVLTISRQRVPVAGGDTTGPLKAGESRRLTFGPLLRSVLLRYQEVTVERAGTLGVAPDWDGWLLSYDGGLTPLGTKALTAAITRLGKDAGVAVTTHVLRHTAASNMALAGVDAATAAERLGHTIEVMHKVYVKAIPDVLRDRAAAEALEAGFLSLPPGLPPGS